MIHAGLIGALIAVIVTVVAINFMSAEKQIQKSLEHRYGVSDRESRERRADFPGNA